MPRWIWAPLPEDPTEAGKIVASAIQGGSDVIAMPRYLQAWEQGLPELRTQLQKVDDIRFFSRDEKKALKQRMRAAGLATDRPDAIALTGRGRPLLAVIDPASFKITAIFKATLGRGQMPRRVPQSSRSRVCAAVRTRTPKSSMIARARSTSLELVAGTPRSR